MTIATNMAGRGTDILLGGNPEFLARRAMRQEDYADEIIEAATGHNENVDQEVLDARKRYRELYEGFKKETDAEHERVMASWAACTSSAPSVTRAAASTTSCAAAPAVRATPAARSSSSAWRTT